MNAELKVKFEVIKRLQNGLENINQRIADIQDSMEPVMRAVIHRVIAVSDKDAWPGWAKNWNRADWKLDGDDVLCSYSVANGGGATLKGSFRFPILFVCDMTLLEALEDAHRNKLGQAASRRNRIAEAAERAAYEALKAKFEPNEVAK
jgi:hypothetical protein